VTAGPRDSRHGGRFDPSVRASRLPRPGRIGWALLGLIVASFLIDGARGLGPAFPRGDLLYHWGLTHGILRGELPPGGPYEGLPAYYPPGFHLILAAMSILGSLSVPDATWLLGFIWLPVLPLTTFALARHVTGRSDMALVAAALTLFGGAYDLAPDRLWVNSLFLVGHQAYPIFPRDLVFGLLPLAMLAFLRSLESTRGWAWAVVAGGLLGACALIQVQLLLPIPIALIVAAVATAVAEPASRRRAAVALVVTGGLTALAVGPWLIRILATIRQNGGVALESADSLLPARFSFWDYPREFGLFLPLAIVGAGLILLHLRERDRTVTGLRPRRPEAPLALIAWFVVPWVLAVLYDPGWPLEDALRPQRLWLLASQPGAILAAIGLVALVHHVVEHRWRSGRLVKPAIVAVVLAVTVPTTLFTVRLLAGTWIAPEYAHLQLDRDRVPDMARILGKEGPRSTVLTYEDWSSLVWYETGSWVVAVNPPGYAKLAFDPQIFTGHSQGARRTDVAGAFAGNPETLGAVANAYGVDQILLARRGERWGLVDQVAAIAAARPAGVSGATRIVDGNGWDAVELQPQGRLILAPDVPEQPIDVEIRCLGLEENQAVPDRHLRLLAVGGGGSRVLTDLVVPATAVDPWQVVRARVALQPGEQLVIDAVDRLTVQSVRGFVAATPPNGWHVVRQNADAIVLERSP
jgi:hypothetical protein